MQTTQDFLHIVRAERKQQKLPPLSVPAARARPPFCTRAAELLQQIADADQNLPSFASKMTDFEHAAIDEEMAHFAHGCANAIARLAASIAKAVQGDKPATPSLLRHQREVVKDLQRRLQQLAKRVERQREARKRLQSMAQTSLTEGHRHAAARIQAVAAGRQARRRRATQRAASATGEASGTTINTMHTVGGMRDSIDTSGVNPEELAQENHSLQAQLEGAAMDVRQVEQKVAQVANLFAVFSNEVMAQHELVDQLEEDADESKASVEKANEELAKSETAASFLAFFTTIFLYSAGGLLLLVHWYLP